MMLSRGFAVIVVTLALAGPALADGVRTVKANTSTGIMASYSCGDTIAASWVVRVPPKNGRVDIRKHAVEADTKVRCQNNGTPPTAARALYYTPNPGFKGTDSFTVGWLGGEHDDVVEQPRTITIEVK
ncbi:MAG: hypothetical protein JNM13_01350 [Hyphomicrobiaceae bacterium]|nr:hypothetical protein [Hyphomicrobiaceae bacterium]